MWANVSLFAGACAAGAHDPYYTDRYPPDYTNKYLKQSTSISLNGGGDTDADKTACTSLGVASAVPLAASDYLSATYRRMHHIAELSGSSSSSSSASMSSEYDDRAIVLAETKGASVLQWSLTACQSVVQSPAPAVALIANAAPSAHAPVHAAGFANATRVAGGGGASSFASAAIGAGVGPASRDGAIVAAAAVAGSPTQAAVRGTAAECGGATRLTLRGANAQAAWALIREIVIFEN